MATRDRTVKFRNPRDAVESVRASLPWSSSSSAAAEAAAAAAAAGGLDIGKASASLLGPNRSFYTPFSTEELGPSRSRKMGKLRHHRVYSTSCQIQYRRWHMRWRLRSAKQTQTRRLITRYFRVRKSTARGVASCPDPPSTTVYSSSGSNSVHKECNHLRNKGFRNKELYYNVFKKNHTTGTSGFGSITMPNGSNPYVEELLSMDNSGTKRVPDEVLTPTNCGQHASNRRLANDTSPSRSRGSAGKRKQRYTTVEMTYMAMQEIVTYLRSRLQSSVSNDQSSRTDHLLMCMNCMTEMGIPQYQRTIMWHYFVAHPQLQHAFHQLNDDDRRGIIDSVVRS